MASPISLNKPGLNNFNDLGNKIPGEPLPGQIMEISWSLLLFSFYNISILTSKSCGNFIHVSRREISRRRVQGRLSEKCEENFLHLKITEMWKERVQGLKVGRRREIQRGVNLFELSWEKDSARLQPATAGWCLAQTNLHLSVDR